jgi:hypothetical protein
MNNLQRNHQLQGLDKKNKRRKPEGSRQFQLYKPVISHSEGQMGHFPDFIYRTKPTAYAKKGMLRALTSFRAGWPGGSAELRVNLGLTRGHGSYSLT